MSEFEWVSVFWTKLEKRLLLVSVEVSDLKGVSVKVGRSSNAKFPLRGYAEILPIELAVTVDLKRENQGWSLSSDICTSEGELLAVGPSKSGIVAAGCDMWLMDFDIFLRANLRRLVLPRLSLEK